MDLYWSQIFVHFPYNVNITRMLLPMHYETGTNINLKVGTLKMTPIFEDIQIAHKPEPHIQTVCPKVLIKLFFMILTDEKKTMTSNYLYFWSYGRYICTILVPKRTRTKIWVYMLRHTKKNASVL